jgi:hypothetical protein
VDQNDVARDRDQWGEGSCERDNETSGAIKCVGFF